MPKKKAPDPPGPCELCRCEGVTFDVPGGTMYLCYYCAIHAGVVAALWYSKVLEKQQEAAA